ncbi:MAG: rRNA maturation RNase YbeY [Patescibacteria group bacterium]
MIHYCVHGRVHSRFPLAVLPRIARDCSKIKRFAARSYDVSISFVTRKKIQQLNRTYRHINKPTDVLSFQAGARSEERGARNYSLLAPRSSLLDLGDLFICAPYAIAEAKRRHELPERELVRMVVHGTLHLMGYDHGTKQEEKRMFGVQEKIVNKSTVRRPQTTVHRLQSNN